MKPDVESGRSSSAWDSLAPRPDNCGALGIKDKLSPDTALLGVGSGQPLGHTRPSRGRGSPCPGRAAAAPGPSTWKPCLLGVTGPSEMRLLPGVHAQSHTHPPRGSGRVHALLSCPGNLSLSGGDRPACLRSPGVREL